MNGSTSAIADQIFDLLAPTSRDPPAITSAYQTRRPVFDIAGLGTLAAGPTAYVFQPLQAVVAVAQQESRTTTPAERAIGEFRRWNELAANWDGEGAEAPLQNSLREASAFACLLADARVVDPMLHANGHAGLYFRTAELYADIEFLGDGRAAYYVERNGGKHKGVVNFDSKEMPAVFNTLLKA